MKKTTIAFLHLLPVVGDVRHNQQLIEKAVNLAAEKNPGWIITPELAVSGLQFSKIIGTEWIAEQPDSWMKRLCSIAKQLKVNLFIGCPEKTAAGNLYNSVFVIDRSGKIIGKQRKVATISDGWCDSGKTIEPIEVDGMKTGVMICADAYREHVADALSEKGANLLIAPSSWGPGIDGPNGEWEQRSAETGLPVFVCNRTGEDTTVSFWEAESKVIQQGKVLLSHQSKQSAILTFDWDLEKMDLCSEKFEVYYL